MSKSPSVKLLHQTVGSGKHLYERIRVLLQTPNLKRFRAAVAYARWDGIGLVSNEIETLLKAGGEYQSIYGVGNGITTPDALFYGLVLQKLYTKHTYAGAVEDKFANATFHPKFFEFKYADRIVAIIGSANFTGGGLVKNTELGAEIEVPLGDGVEAELVSAWNALKAESTPVTLAKIRALKKELDLGSEGDQTSESDKKKSGKPFLNPTAKTNTKPLFAKVLGLDAPKKKLELLSILDPVSEKPARLYLQVLKNETGGSGGHAGYQIQLPTATLAAYFGVGPTEEPDATFKFGAETIHTHFTHFSNNTHRLRLKPLQGIVRPAVVVFDRVSASEYKCTIVPATDYAGVLAAKCKEQTRPGVRKWGLE
jgi:HKD family nuclease